MKEQKKVVQADYPERLGIGSLLGDNNYSNCFRLEYRLITVVTLFVKGDFQGSAVGYRHRVHAAEVLRGLNVNCLNCMGVAWIIVIPDDLPADRDIHSRSGRNCQVGVERDVD